MIKHFFPNPAVFERLHAGPLGGQIEAFAQELSDRGYAVWTAKYAMRLLADLSKWLEQTGRPLTTLDEQAADAFLQHRYQSHRQHREDQGTLAVVLAYLRSQGVLTSVAERQQEDGGSSIRGAFHRHLISQRDLAPSTVQTYLDTVRRFLDWRFGTHSPQVDMLCAQDVNDFMLEQARRYSAGHTQLIASALRCFLRFLRQTGDIAVDLARYVPAPARRQLSGLPKYMPAEDVERLLQSIGQESPQGRRDYAIVLLVARLGLRANEVATLRLEDVDWSAGELVIRGKASRVERLPLPWDVGEALSHYLRDARPPCSVRQVFLCLRAPRRGFCNAARSVPSSAGRWPVPISIPHTKGLTCCAIHWLPDCCATARHSPRSRSCYVIATSTPPGFTPRSMNSPWASWPPRGREVCNDHLASGS